MRIDPSLSINIMGAGTVAKALVRVWCDRNLVSVAGVVNRSLESSSSAVQFLGEGEAHADVKTLPTADLWLIGCNDDAIEPMANELARAERLPADAIVFHLSGNHSSRDLACLRPQSPMLASLHPLKSFPDSAHSYRQFGTPYCVLEGHNLAVGTLAELCQRMDCPTTILSATQKPLYHLANTILSNGLIGLLDAGLGCYQDAGINQSEALAMIRPLLTETLSNGLSQGPELALTGPIVRGDSASVQRHLKSAPAAVEEVYRTLSLVIVDVAARSGRLSATGAAEIRHLLSEIQE